MGTIFVVATPIGNLKDITLRALEVLKDVDLILCEDTRRTKNLLDRYKISKPILSYHQHSNLKKTNYILRLLKEGKNLALVCDAGTPGISDPGNQLLAKIIETFKDQVKIVPIPGPSAITAIASICALPMEKFLFFGFLPKRKQKKIIEELAFFKYPVIIFESPFRIIKTLERFASINPEMKVVVGKELTKKFEEVFYGNVKEVIEKLKKSIIKGEFILVFFNEKK